LTRQLSLPTGDLASFEATLEHNLDPGTYRFFSPVHNPERVRTPLELLSRHAEGDSGLLLNVGSGPFVLEFLLEGASSWKFLSIDSQPGYAPLYGDLRRQKLLERTSFVVMDLRYADFPAGSFSWVVAHDVLFEPRIDVFDLLPKFASWLAPGGLLYFDVWDSRAETLWKLAKRDLGFRRYDLGQVREALNDAGLTLVSELPYLGRRGILRFGRRVLWACIGFSNTRHFLVQKSA
jgi:hypothetical protein